MFIRMVVALNSLLGVPLAYGSVCSEPETPGYVAGRLVEHGKSEVGQDLGEMAQQSRSLDILVAAKPGRLSLGFRHRYTKFNFAGFEPQTNAHLHVSEFPVHWFDRGKKHRLSIAPGLGASSNILGKPAAYRSDTARFSFALLRHEPITETLSTWYGVCADDNFGGWKPYPTAGVEWQPQAQWKINLGFPSTGIRYEFSERLETSVTIAPDGNEWHVANRDFGAYSSFQYEALALQWSVELQGDSGAGLALSIGRQLRNRLEMTLQNGERIAVTTEDVNRAGLEISWRF